ncbi:MAG: DUF1015 domain-containing protein, partial [Acidimicrobiales bacterium]
MPRFEPFAGLRYDPSVPLGDVIAPPYDVVSERERVTLASRHGANAIHVELPADDPAEGLDRYHSAARLLREWTREGLLRRDTVPSFYAYRMTEPGGIPTTGVIGALECRPDRGDVLPHEQTMRKDMTDRLELLRAARVNTSPIWGLSLTEGLSKTFEPAGPPHAAASDGAGVLHELWVVADAATIEAVSESVAASPVVIADGHHRYETALAYRAEQRATNGDEPGDYDYVMALVVELSEQQLSVGAIHRVVEGVSDDVDLVEVFGKWFDCTDVGATDRDKALTMAQRHELGLATRKKMWRLAPRQAAFDEAGSDLDSSLVELALDGTGAEVRYSHDPQEAVAQLSA